MLCNKFTGYETPLLKALKIIVLKKNKKKTTGKKDSG